MGKMIKWTWPQADGNQMGSMMAWMAQSELKSVSVPEPPIISEKERMDISMLYRKMDLDGKGHCTPFDIAGGDHLDFKVRLANTIDEATVKLILGNRAIELPEFLELMCEDGFRGTPDSIVAISRDGPRIRRHTTTVARWDGWIPAELSPDQK